MDVSASAVKVAVALAYHGWTSWPSRETLCRLTNLKSPHVTRATNELEKAGFIARRRRYHTGGNVGIQYTFNGLALAEATIHQEHPTLQTAITKLVTAPVNAQEPETDRDYQFGNGGTENATRQEPTAVTNLVTAPENAQNQSSDRDYQIGNGARERPEPETDRDYQFGNGGTGSDHEAGSRRDHQIGD